MADFFREVEEDYRRDQLIKFWKRYQAWIIAAAVLLVIGVAGWRAYVYFRNKADFAAGARFEAALDLLEKGQSAKATAGFKALARTGPTGYATLSRMMIAGEISAHDPAAGIKAFDAVGTEPGLDSRLKAVARLRAAILRLDHDPAKEFDQRYANVAGATDAYRNSYRELLALAAIKRGDMKAAGMWLDEIVTDTGAPAALRNRANAFLALVKSGKLPKH